MFRCDFLSERVTGEQSTEWQSLQNVRLECIAADSLIAIDEFPGRHSLLSRSMYRIAPSQASEKLFRSAGFAAIGGITDLRFKFSSVQSNPIWNLRRDTADPLGRPEAMWLPGSLLQRI